MQMSTRVFVVAERGARTRRRASPRILSTNVQRVASTARLDALLLQNNFRNYDLANKGIKEHEEDHSYY